MRISFIKPAALAAATTLASAGVVVATTAAAQADSGHVDITAVSGIVYASPSSVSTDYDSPARIAVTLASGVGSWYPQSADVYRGSVKVGTATLSKTDDTHMSVRVPNAVGRGAFTLRNIKISWYMADYSNSGTDIDASTAGGIRVVSSSAGNLSSYGTAFKIGVRGKTHKFTAGLKYYGPSGWRPWAGEKVKIQQNSGGWKTVKTLKLNSKGKASWTRKTGKKYRYRLVAPNTATVVGGSSTFSSKM